MGEFATCNPTRLRGGWLEARSGGVYTLARHWPPRFDLRVQTQLSVPARGLSRRRLAQQVRQDLWRALRGLRGFSPVVQVALGEGEVTVIAGGRLIARAPTGAVPQIQNVLDDPARRARWIAWAERRAI